MLTPRCQVDNCRVELLNAGEYNRRRKVCAEHVKASKATVHNFSQRFCLMCTRFHVLKEFKYKRRSCKKQLELKRKRYLDSAKRKPYQVPRCQVRGCRVELLNVKHYLLRGKVCEKHSKATSVWIQKKKNRFCQKCFRFHVLEEFEFQKRTCRRKLETDRKLTKERRRKALLGGEVLKCQVDDCGVELLSFNLSLQLGKVCENHSRATWAWIQKEKKRYCQKCRRFHVLEEFDPQMKSCREILARLRKRRLDSAKKNISKVPKPSWREMLKAAAEIDTELMLALPGAQADTELTLALPGAQADNELTLALPGAQVTHSLPEAHANAPKRTEKKTTALKELTEGSSAGKDHSEGEKDDIE